MKSMNEKNEQIIIIIVINIKLLLHCSFGSELFLECVGLLLLCAGGKLEVLNVLKVMMGIED
jgi:hypothetical protein